MSHGLQKSHNSLLMAFTCLLSILVIPAGSSAPMGIGRERHGYIVETIQIRGASAVQITGMNNHGHVVGWYRTKHSLPGQANAFLWHDHKFTDLGILVRQGDKKACNINDKAVIVGTRWKIKEDSSAFMYKNGDTSVVSGLKESSGINNRGTIIGIVVDSHNRKAHPALWKQGQIIPIVDTTNRFATYEVNAVNDQDEVIGMIADADNGWFFAYCWRAGVFTRLSTLGGPFSSALAINNRGAIAGYSADSKNRPHVVSWYDGKLLNTSKFGRANGINFKGDMVGRVGWHACRFSRESVLDLQDVPQLLPSSRSSDAVAINDSGQISINGDTWAVVLTPVKSARKKHRRSPRTLAAAHPDRSAGQHPDHGLRFGGQPDRGH